ncbi:glycoside hydrolase family 3 N-terminal domain-containing protein [Isoptericola sp. b515]|uniref:glycoside hydrolase family 3 C-terminal domain-containing protein n=1 Tax=Isoptericola sp. b515 TaxID=3064652 RepID=UPI0027140CCF|nr:glycoside hydrolase family 3 N-terminal domain-containing protein [Isoptericola sp. b515]MDO8147472.1 glycoside hydrolase family 3 N-terminal domain-containing protein [Isoptericola sp. b515]
MAVDTIATTPLAVAHVPRLVAELTLEEKASLCSGQDFWNTQAVDRLGIPAVMVTDGPHGLRKQAGAADHVGLHDSVPATCFPTAAGLASTWDRDVVRRVGEALGVETRAHDVGVLLGPGVNMKRSPLCGRNFEYFSEDPHLAGELAADLVDGIQSQGVGTSLKHFAANNQETDRMRVSAEVDERTLREIYLPAFETVVTRAQPWTVMCAYNKVNGVYASQDPWLLTEVLRDEWGFEGLVVSDWGAVDDRVEAVAAGLDLEMPSSAGINDARIVAAVRAGELDEALVDQAATRVLTVVARALEAAADPGTFDAATHHALAHEVATRTAVLLKNDGDVLPLDPAAADDLVVVGEMARTPRYQGAGSSQVNPTRLVSALDALAERGLDVPFHPGYVLAEAAGRPGQDRGDAELRAEAVTAAAGRTAVVFAGLPAVDESEGYDREHMELPASHLALLREVSAVARRTVVVLSNGSAVTVSGWEDSVDAILETWLGGQAAGSAAVALLLGEAAPSGRLAESIPVALADVPAQLNFPGENGSVRYGEGLFIGYRGLDATGADVSYPFGHGLTYTTFEHTDLTVESDDVTADTAPGDVVVRVGFTVTNTGSREGVAVPQLYVGRPGSAVTRAPRELRGFEAVTLQPGDSRRVELTLTRRDLSHWDTATHAWVVEPGALEVAVGASSRDLPLTATVDVVAPEPVAPLHRYSTIDEWRRHPEAWAALVDAMGDAAQMFDTEADPAMAAMLSAIPGIKVTTMGFSDGLTPERFEELLTRYGQA